MVLGMVFGRESAHVNANASADVMFPIWQVLVLAGSLERCSAR